MIRIVQISDLHLGLNPATYFAPLLSGMAAADQDSLMRLAESAGRPALAHAFTVPEELQCIIAGDLSAGGRPGELIEALTYVRGELQTSVSVPVTGLHYPEGNSNFVLGNHDIWGGANPMLVWISGEKRQAAARLAVMYQTPAAWRVASQGALVGYLDDRSLRVRAYLLDSTFPGLGNVFARGSVGEKQLTDLQHMVLADAALDQGKTVLRIAVLHHSLDSHHAIAMRLEDGHRVAEVLDALEFGLVLCGHEHESDVHRLTQTGMCQCTSGSATQTTRDRRSNEFFVHDLEPSDSFGCVLKIRRYHRPGVQTAPFHVVSEEDVSPRVAHP